MKKTNTLILLVLISSLVFASQKRKVMIIGIDGTRSDALQQANTPVLDSLIANGTYSFNAYHMGITVSGPSWSDIMCGVWEAKHNVTNNDYTNSRYNTYPYFTTRAKSIKPDLYCVQVVEWSPLNDKVYNDSWNKKVLTACDGCQDTRNNTSELACQEISNENLDCIFIYYDQPDITGHSSGFNPNNPSYIAAIEYVDTRLRKVMNCLKGRPTYAEEDWLILLIPDHGGIGTGHGDGSKETRNIWWIASGSAVPKQQITASDPGTYNILHQIINQIPAADPAKIKLTPVQTDIGVTALHHLLADSIGDSIQQYITRWNLDGKSWLTRLSTPTGIINKNTASVDFKIFPNPVNENLTIWTDFKNEQEIQYTVTDMKGKNVLYNEVKSTYKINIDCSGLSEGIYTIQIRLSNGDISVQKFIKQ
jgi:hypothetical protein